MAMKTEYVLTLMPPVRFVSALSARLIDPPMTEPSWLRRARQVVGSARACCRQSTRLLAHLRENQMAIARARRLGSGYDVIRVPSTHLT